MKLPTGWKLQRIEEVADVKGGKRLPKGYSLVTENTGFPYIRVTDMKNGTVDESGVMYIPVDVAPRISRYIINKSDVFISVAGNLGVTGIIPESLDGANLTENADKLTNLKINQKFLFEVLRSPIIQNRVEAEKTQNAQPKLALTRIKSFEIPVPPLPEQKKVAQIFSAWDKAINVTEQLLANSQQQKKALMQQLLTGEKRLLDDNGVRFEGEWKLHSVRDVSLCITKGTTPSTNGYQFKESGIPFVKVESIREDGSIDKAKLAYIDEECHQSFRRSQLEPGDVLFSIAGALGRVALVPVWLATANTNQAVCLIRFHQGYIDQSFAYFILQSPKIRREIAAETAQAAQPNLSLANVGSFRIPVPVMKEQQKIAAVLSRADQDISTLQQKLDALKQEKKALIQQLLTGKRRVKVDDKERAKC